MNDLNEAEDLILELSRKLEEAKLAKENLSKEKNQKIELLHSLIDELKEKFDYDYVPLSHSHHAVQRAIQRSGLKDFSLDDLEKVRAIILNECLPWKVSVKDRDVALFQVVYQEQTLYPLFNRKLKIIKTFYNKDFSFEEHPTIKPEDYWLEKVSVFREEKIKEQEQQEPDFYEPGIVRLKSGEKIEVSELRLAREKIKNEKSKPFALYFNKRETGLFDAKIKGEQTFVWYDKHQDKVFVPETRFDTISVNRFKKTSDPKIINDFWL